jgi:hypothetical protein
MFAGGQGLISKEGYIGDRRHGVFRRLQDTVRASSILLIMDVEVHEVRRTFQDCSARLQQQRRVARNDFLKRACNAVLEHHSVSLSLNIDYPRDAQYHNSMHLEAHP